MQRSCLMLLAAGAILVLSSAEANAQGPIRNAWRRVTGRDSVATTYTTSSRTYTTSSRDRIFFDGERDFVIGRRTGGRTWLASNRGRTFYRTAPSTTVVGPTTRVDPNVAPASATEDANTNPARRTPANPATPPRQ